MKEIATIGVDLAKSVFAVHGVDAAGHMVLHKTVRRERLVELIAGLPPCQIGMEACGGAHERARKFQEHGHRVGIMMARFVAPYRKSSKNDGNDAEAICEALDHLPLRPSPPALATGTNSPTAGSLRRGWDWCRDNTRPAVSRAWAASPNGATPICARC